MNTLEKQFCDSSCGSSSQLAKSVTGSAYINMEAKPILIPSKRKRVEIEKPDTVQNSTTEDIKRMISVEEKQAMQGIERKIQEESDRRALDDSQDVLAHFGNFTEQPYHLIESYFRGQHLERLVRHQIESYNHFVNYQIQRTIQMFNSVTIHSENDFVEERGKYFLEVLVSFENFKLYPPQIHENNGATKLMLPQEAKLRNFTYASTMTVDINIKFVVRNGENLENAQTFYKSLPKIHIGKMPIMLKSSICVLNQYKHVENVHTGECKFDAGGYFIINGSEKTVLGQERAAENRVYCFNVGKNSTKYSWSAEIKSVPDFKCISPKQINLYLSSKNNGFGCPIYVQLPRLKQPIALFVLFRALGIISDQEICQKILLNLSGSKEKEVLQGLQASIIDANGYLTQEECIRHITTQEWLIIYKDCARRLLEI